MRRVHLSGSGLSVRRATGLPVELRNVAPEAVKGDGQGLIGLTERAALVDGRLEHGRTVDGDFRLAAWLPWPA